MVTHASTCQSVYDRFHGKRQTKLFLWIFSWISAIFQKQLKTLLLNRWRTREKMWKRDQKKRYKDRWRYCMKKNGKFQIGLVGLGKRPSTRGFGFLFGPFRPRSEGFSRGWRVWARVGQFRSGTIRSYRVGPFGTKVRPFSPAVGQFPMPIIKIFLTHFLWIILVMRKTTIFFWLWRYFSFRNRTSGSSFMIILVHSYS